MPKKENEKKKANTRDNKNKTGGGAQSAKPVVKPPKPTPEQIKERKRTEHQSKLEELRTTREKVEQKFIKRYGPRGQMYAMNGQDDYDLMVINPPKDLDPLEISMVVMGSCMRPEWLDRPMTGSGFPPGSTTVVDFNQEFLVQNIVVKEDKRLGHFPPVLLEGRAEAREAIEAYKKGDATRMVEMVDNFIKVAVHGLKDQTYYSLDQAFAYSADDEFGSSKSMLLMAGRILEKEPFKSHSTVSEGDHLKLTAYLHLSEAQSACIDQKLALMKEPPKANTKEREDQVAEFLFNEYLSNTLATVEGEKGNLHEQERDRLLEEIGVVPDSQDYSIMCGNGNNINRILLPLMNNAKVRKVTDREAILAAPDYREKFRNLYMEEIRKTDHYKKLVSAEGNEFKDALLESEKKTRKGFGEFENVKPNNESAAINQTMQAAYDAEVRRVRGVVGTVAEEIALARGQITEFNAEGTKQLHKRAIEIRDDFVKNLPESQLERLPGKGENLFKPKVTDPMYKKLFTALADMGKEAETLVPLGQKKKVTEKHIDSYSTMIDRAIAAADEYLEANKAVPAEAEARDAYYSVLRVKRSLTGHKIGVTRAMKQTERYAEVRKIVSSKKPVTGAETDPLIRGMKEELEMERFGADEAKNRMLDKAITATGRLGELISKDGELTPDEMAEAKNCVKDVFGYKLYTTMRNHLDKTLPVPCDTVISGAIDRIPEFAKETGHLTKKQLLQFAAGRKSEEIIGITGDASGLPVGDKLESRRTTLTTFFEDELTSRAETKTAEINKKLQDRKDRAAEEYKRRVMQGRVETVKALYEDHHGVYRLYHQYYGSKPNMPEGLKLHQDYNAITIDPPKDMDENMVTAIVLGGIMQEERLKYRSTTSNFRADKTTFQNFNQNFLIENMIKTDPDLQRQGSIPLAMVAGRKKAYDAIEDYKAGKPEKARELLETFINFGVDSLENVSTSNSDSLFNTKTGLNNEGKTLIQMTGELIGKPPLNAQGKATEAEKEKCKAFDLYMKTIDRIYDTKYKILSEPEKPGSKERAQQLDELIFNEFLVSTVSMAKSEKEKMANAYVNGIYEKLGLDSKLDFEARTDVQSMASTEGIEIEQNFNLFHRTDLEYLTGTPEGIETLRKAYLPEIRKSNMYKQLLSAEGDKYAELLLNVDQEAEKGLQSIKGVKIGNPSADFNARNEAQLSLRNAELEEKINDIARMVNRSYFREQDGSIDNTSFDMRLRLFSDVYDNFTYNMKQVSFASSGQLKNFKKAFDNLQNHANAIANQDEIRDADARKYSELAMIVEKNAADMIKKADLSKANKQERKLIMMCRRAQTMLKASREVILAPILQRQRESDMEEQKQKIDPAKQQAFLQTHEKGSYSKEDLLYASLSKDAMNSLHRMQKEYLDEQKVGTQDSRKSMIDSAKTATTELSKMILKGEDYIKTHQAEAKGFVSEIMAERVLARFNTAGVPLIEPKTYASRLVNRIPEFTAALNDLTIGKIGSYVFDRAADKVIAKIPKQNLMDTVDEEYRQKYEEGLAEIEKIEEARGKKAKEKKEIKEEVKEEENPNKINEIKEEENPNKINEVNEEKGQEKEPEKPKNIENFVEDMTFIEIKLFSDELHREAPLVKPVEEPKKVEEEPKVEQPVKPVEEPKKEEEEPKVEQPVKPKEEPKKEEEEPKGQPEGMKEVEPKAQPEGMQEVEPKAQPEGMQEVEPKVQPEGIQGPQPDLEQLQSFSNAVHVFNYSRERFLSGLNALKEKFLTDRPRPRGMSDEEFRQHALSEFGTTGNQKYQDVEARLDSCISVLSDPKSTPQQMWNSMKQFRKASAVYAKDFDTWNPFAGSIRKNQVIHAKESVLTMRVMMSAFESATAPLTDPGFGYGTISAENCLSRNMEDICNECRNAETKGRELYDMKVMSVRQAQDEYAVLEDLSKERLLVKEACEKKAKGRMTDELHTENKDQLLQSKTGTLSVYDVAEDCLLKSYIVRSGASKDPAELRTMREEIRSSSFNKKVTEMAEDPLFRQIAFAHPDTCYTRWARIENKAENIRQEAGKSISGFNMRGGMLGAAGYVAFGDGPWDPAAPERDAARNARLARVITDSILKDPQYGVLQRAIAAKQLTKADVVIEALDYVERKHINILNNNNQIRPDFRRRLENGDLVKGMVNSQKAILERASRRDPQERRNVTRKFNLNNTQKKQEIKQQNPVFG